MSGFHKILTVRKELVCSALSKPPHSESLFARKDALTGMNAETAQSNGGKIRLLVAIASFGEKNIEFLKRIVRNYQEMSISVDVVVFSDKPKNLGRDVKVIVGLPFNNPWSLPFAHKAYFAQNVGNYDLFIYSEDDMEVMEKNVRAFLRITEVLDPDEIAGFLRYEVDEPGNRSLPEVHGPFHWELDSVRRRGDYTIAEFTNEHAACYLMTQEQLRQAVHSGAFLRGPYEGRHDMLCTAATDPYTCCGFRKVICISALEDFLIHHLPNRYTGEFGLSLDMFKTQIQTLIDVQNGIHPASTLCEVETKFNRRRWSKLYYGGPDKELLDMIPHESKTVLSVGCGGGAIEQELLGRGASVTALPLDSVIGAMAARLGIEMIYKTLLEGLSTLRGREFDCVLVADLLHLQPNPWEVLGKCSQLVAPGGVLVIQSPNFNYLPVWFRRVFGLGEMRKLKSFSEGGVTAFGMSALERQLRALGFHVSGQRWFSRPHFKNEPPPKHFGIRRFLGRLMAEDWIVQARKCGANVQPNRERIMVDRVPLEV